MTAFRQSGEVDGREEWTASSWHYRAWMTDTGMPIMAYDNFSGPPCRWDYSAGELARTTLLDENASPPDEGVFAEIAAIAEERRLL